MNKVQARDGENKTTSDPDSKTLSSEGSWWLHRSPAVCSFALAFWAYSFAFELLRLGKVEVLHPTADWLDVLGYGVVIWVLVDLARRCKQLLERLFYWVFVVDCIVLGTRAAIPMSGMSAWMCQLLLVILSGIEVALSGAILLWHFRTRIDGSNSKEPT